MTCANLFTRLNSKKVWAVKLIKWRRRLDVLMSRQGYVTARLMVQMNQISRLASGARADDNFLILLSSHCSNRANADDIFSKLHLLALQGQMICLCNVTIEVTIRQNVGDDTSWDAAPVSRVVSQLIARSTAILTCPAGSNVIIARPPTSHSRARGYFSHLRRRRVLSHTTDPTWCEGECFANVPIGGMWYGYNCALLWSLAEAWTSDDRSSGDRLSRRRPTYVAVRRSGATTVQMEHLNRGTGFASCQRVGMVGVKYTGREWGRGRGFHNSHSLATCSGDDCYCVRNHLRLWHTVRAFMGSNSVHFSQAVGE